MGRDLRLVENGRCSGGGGSEGGHDGRRRQGDRDVVVFTQRPCALALGRVSAHRHTVLHHFHALSFLKMYEFTGRPITKITIKILAHREGVQ